MCINECPAGDIECLTECSREFSANTENCPCQSGCPGGCPCPDYVCPVVSTSIGVTTTPSHSTTSASSTVTLPVNPSVLVLNTHGSQPLITNAAGKIEYGGIDFDFTYGPQTEVYYSCSIVWHGQLYLFGGDREKNQISTLNGCFLERVGSLSFHHYQGACTTVHDQTIFLCFNNESGDYKKCRKSTRPTGLFLDVEETYKSHRQTRIAASAGRLDREKIF